MANEALPSLEVLRQLLRYEPETGKLFWLERPAHFFTSVKVVKTWNVLYAGKQALNTANVNGYFYGSIFAKNHYAHRIGFYLSHEWMPKEIDHIDGNRKNNCLSNLRSVTRSMNNRNMAARSDNTSGRTGVRFDKRDGAFYAYGSATYLGRFRTFQDAVVAREAYEAENGYSKRHGSAPEATP